MKKAFWDVDLYTGGEDGEYYTVMRVFFFAGGKNGTSTIGRWRQLELL